MLIKPYIDCVVDRRENLADDPTRSTSDANERDTVLDVHGLVPDVTDYRCLKVVH